MKTLLIPALAVLGLAACDEPADQPEKGADVAIVAALLGRPPEEIASRAGISTPVPAAEGVAARLDRIEAKLDELLRRLGG